MAIRDRLAHAMFSEGVITVEEVKGMEDLRVVTGARPVSDEVGLRLEILTLEDLGSAKRVVANRDNTTIVGGGGSPAEIEGRCRQLRSRIEPATSDHEREKLQEGLAKLSAGVAVIRVGAPSEAEMKVRKAAFEDEISLRPGSSTPRRWYGWRWRTPYPWPAPFTWSKPP